MNVFIDTSVIIAALISPTGASSLIMRYIKVKRITGIISQTVIDELIEKQKKLKRSKEELKEFIAQSGLIVRKHISTEEIKPYEDFVDQEDAHLIAGANLTKCSYLVTLDKKHLLRPDIKEKILPLRLVSPKELLVRNILNTTYSYS